MNTESEPIVKMDENEEAAIRLYLEARRQGHGPIMAARLVNSTAADIEVFARLNPEFQRAVEDAVDESLERVEAKVKESAQEGDMTAAKLVLESHLPERWSKPDREMVLRLGQPEAIDVDALHARLKEIEAGTIIDVESEEVTDG